MILIYPPVAKICEPPGGVAYLAGALKQVGVECTVIDANLEGLLWLGRDHFRDNFHDSLSDNFVLSCSEEFHRYGHSNHRQFSLHKQYPYGSGSLSQSKLHWQPASGLRQTDIWTKRAVKYFDRNISDLKDPCLYKNFEKYRQRIFDVNRAISSSSSDRFKISLSDYHDLNFVPVKSCDLISSFENFHENPFYRYFEDCLYERLKIANSGETGRPYSVMGDYIGISLCYLSQALTGFALAGWIKSNFPEKKIIMGGGLVTSWMSFPDWKNPFVSIIDMMVKGQGEKTLLKIVGKNMERKGRRFHFVPDFDFAYWDSYLAPARILPYRASTGCYWNKCRFCPEKAEKSRYEYEKATDVLHDLAALNRRYHPDIVHFLDNAMSLSLLRTLSDKRMPFIWYGFVRFMKELADPVFTRKLYNSGCRMLKLGLESGDQEVLDYMHKGTNLVIASNVLKALKDAGIATYIYILFGTLHETEESAGKTLAYVADHSDEIDFINTAIFNMPRFSEDADVVETKRFYDGDLSLYLNFVHPRGWNRQDIRRFISKRFKKNSFIAHAIRNVPPFFTSNHAVFVLH